MLFGIAFLVAAVVTTWRERLRWRLLIAPAVTATALLTAFALAEGNTGTLVRHRGMVVPFVALLAGLTIGSCGAWIAHRLMRTVV